MSTIKSRENSMLEPEAMDTPMSDELDAKETEPTWVVENVVIDGEGKEYEVVDVDWANGHIGKVSLQQKNSGLVDKEFEVLPKQFSQYLLKKTDDQEEETLP